MPYTAIKFGRKAIGIELKQSYFNIAIKNLEKISNEVTQVDLFSYKGDGKNGR